MSFNATFTIPDWDDWTKIDNDEDILVQLHKHYWGRVTVEQVHAGTSSSGPSASGSPHDQSYGAGTILQIHGQKKWTKTIWVREEYVRIYEDVVNYYERQIALKDQENGGVIRPPAAVITGQPGIGKSLWLYYVLIRCLVRQRPVIWHRHKKPYIFAEDGVYRMGSNFPGIYSNELIWTLLDAHEFRNGVPEEYVARETPFFVVYTTSPSKERWSHLHKTVSEIVIIMNPWSLDEVHNVVQLRVPNPGSKTLNAVNNAYETLGPTLRICVDIALDPRTLETYKKVIEETVDNLSLQKLEEFMNKLQLLTADSDSMSHNLCLIKRKDLNDLRSGYEVTHITDHIRSKLVIHMRNLDTIQQINFYRTFARPPARVLAGYAFEALCQRQFQKRIFIEYSRMVRLDHRKPEKDKQRYPQWHSCHEPVENVVLEARRKTAFEEHATLDVSPSETREYNDLDLHDFIPTQDIYYVPRRENAVAMDSFIYHDNRLYIFQFTVSPEHDINSKIIERLGECAYFPELSNWLFVFIIPDDVAVLKTPYSKDFLLQRLNLFSSRIGLDQYEDTVTIGDEERKEYPSKKQKRADSGAGSFKLANITASLGFRGSAKGKEKAK